MDIKDNSVEGLGKKEESHRESLYNCREYIYHHDKNAVRKINIKDTSAEILGKK